MFALRDSRRGMAGGAKGEAPEAWTPKRVWGPIEGVGAWTVAKATTTALSPFAPSHIDESRWSNKQNKQNAQGLDRGQRRGEGKGGRNNQEKPGETTVARKTRRRRRAYQARRPPAGAIARARPGRCFAKH